MHPKLFLCFYRLVYIGKNKSFFVIVNCILKYFQVALAIAVAEEELQFEHRDLHWGNILLSRIPLHEKITFKLGGREIKIGSYGIKATIIDFTMSRISANGVDIYTDLGKDCGIFNGSGDYQFEIYQLMQKKNG